MIDEEKRLRSRADEFFHEAVRAVSRLPEDSVTHLPVLKYETHRGATVRLDPADVMEILVHGVRTAGEPTVRYDSKGMPVNRIELIQALLNIPAALTI